MQFFYKYPDFVTMLYNVFHHLSVKNKDFPICICGDEGLGKTHFVLHLYELWYRVILQREVTEDDVRNIHVGRMGWLQNFKNIGPFEMNVNDEGADGIASKESIKRFGRDLEKLYKVFRKKRFFSPILLPEFFDLPKYFRRRVRMVIEIDREGHFRVFSKEGVKWLNALNRNREPKSMNVARPFYQGVFPEYKGVMLEPYIELSQSGVDNILDEIIEENKNGGKTPTAAERKREDIIRMLSEGVSKEDIKKALRTSNKTIADVEYGMMKNNS